MLFDAAAWALIIATAYAIGTGALSALGAEQLRAGDWFILAVWIGVVLAAVALLGASLFVPLSPAAGLAAVGALVAVATWVVARDQRRSARRRPTAEAPIPAPAVIAGGILITAGAAALASDPVTLYDSLVYHVGIMEWLREHGTVPGIALIHNRLGHVSAWFTLSAPFDSGPAIHRAANVALGVALVLVATQGAIALGRIASRGASGADWFLLMASAALICAAVLYDAATPSPDVGTNALIVVVAWAMLVMPRAASARERVGWRRLLTPRLVPFVLAAGATSMKLFALPAAVAAAVFYALGRGEDRGMREVVARAAVCCIVGGLLLAPFLAANVIASGCPLYPSPMGCLRTAWSVGPSEAADYAVYIRDVARLESRESVAGALRLPWIGSWIAAHPVVTTLVLLAPILALVLLNGPRRDGVRSAALVAILGIAFAAWQAPAPRFLYAFVIIVPTLALAYPLAALARRGDAHASRGAMLAGTRRAARNGFVAFAVVAGAAYALASQKLNLMSAVTRGGDPMPARGSELVLPAAPEAPARLYRWRVNDVDVLTPVPRPIADTLSYHSAIERDAAFEKCSTAPLPCTPYLPGADVRLRAPERGLAAGFVRAPAGPELTVRGPQCIGEISARFGLMLSGRGDTPAEAAAQCGESMPR